MSTRPDGKRSRNGRRPSRLLKFSKRGFHVEVLEDRRLLSVAGSAPETELALMEDGTYGLSPSPPASWVASLAEADLPDQVGQEPAGPSAEAMSFVLTALDEYVSAPDPNFSFELVNTFVGSYIGLEFDGYVLKLKSQEWRTSDEVNRTLWEHWLIVSVPQTLSPENHTALLAISGGNNNSATPPSNFSMPELGFISLLTGTVVAELRMVPNQPLTFSADGEDAATFLVSGQSGTNAELTFQFDSAPGSFLTSFGYFDVSSVTADPLLAPRDYAVQAINNGTIVFDERTDAIGSSITVNVPTGTELGFFIIPNDTAANFLANPDAYYDPPANSGDIFANRRSPLFSIPDANPGQLDQMAATLHGGVTRLRFEDLTRIPGGGADQNFNDVLISIATELEPVPLPEGSDYFGFGRTEDAIIAYTFDQFLTTGDDTWPALLPMVKSATRAMDAIQQYVPNIVPGATVDDFVVMGGSKRGWTTWLTAAVDAASAAPRVKAIIPIVFDVLNMVPQLDHHQEYYEGVTASIIDGYSNALKDYTALDIFDRRGTPEGEALLSIVDPYSYRDRLTLPKFMINSTGDEFFVPDSGQFYLGELPGQNYLRYVPNTGHNVLDNSDASESLIAYYNAILYDLPLPQFSWTVEDEGTTIRVQTIDSPLQVNVWQATNYDSRDFRRSVTGVPWFSSPLEDQGDGEYVAHMSVPNLGATAFFIELVYPGTYYKYKFTTQVSVLAPEPQTPVEPWLVPRLVEDVNAETYSSDVSSMTDVNGTMYFTAYNPASGRELWKSDGTADGTVRIDIAPGPQGSYPRNLVNFNGALYFVAIDPLSGNKLWKSDGTPEGTMRVAPPGQYPAEPDDLTVVDDTLFFTARDSTHGRELWKSDGTAEGTLFVADVRPTSPYGYPRSSYPRNLTAVNGTLFFTAQDDGHGLELWTSDGTAEGTVLVKDIRPTSPYGYPRSSNPQNLTAVGGVLFFTAYDDEHGSELWTSDGTEEGTILFDVLPNSSYGFVRGSDPRYLTEVDGVLFFTARDDEHGQELWKSDGTPEGTLLVADIRPGSPYGYPRNSDPRNLTDVNGVLYFTAVDNRHGRELWKSDGSTDGTVLVANIVLESLYFGRGSYPENLTAVNGTLFFTAADDDHGRELWKTDGSAAGAVLVKDIRLEPTSGNPSTSSYPTNLTNVGGALFFLANDGAHGQELWTSDGTTGGTFLVKDVRTETFGSYPFSFTDVDGSLFFLVNNDAAQRTELWKTDGTVDGAELVANYWSQGSINEMTEVSGRLFFSAYDNAHGRELWTSDGTAAGTRLVADILPSSPTESPRSSYPSNLTGFNGTLFFTATDDEHGNELWKSDGTAEGTLLVADIRPNSSYGVVHSSFASFLTVVDGRLFFTALDGQHGRELWTSDGTAEGTLLVADIRPNSPYGTVRGSEPRYLTAVDGLLFFTAYDNEHGRELWRSDGTAEGTLLMADVNPGSPYGYPRSSYPANLTNVNGTLFFTAYDNEHGRELWVSDGTAEGTLRLADLTPGTGTSDPSELTAVNDTLFFTIYHPSLGRELWKSDGTEQGTIPVKNISPGQASANPSELTEVNGLLFFTAIDGQHGVELWQSDGTTGGTVMVADSRPGSTGSYPSQLTNVGGTLFFAANGQQTGNEPWLLAEPVPGDATGDGLVDASDYAIWADHFLMQTNRGRADGDFNSDGVVDAADYTVWADHFSPAEASPASVPFASSVSTATVPAVMGTFSPILQGLPAAGELHAWGSDAPSGVQVEARLSTAPVSSRPLVASAVDSAIGTITGTAKSRPTGSQIASLLHDGGSQEFLPDVVDSLWDDRGLE